MDKASRSGRLRGGKRARSFVLSEESPEETLKEERERLVRERQREVEGVLDRHDDLVRELFHLERFVSLLSYEPQEAKKDASPVFLEYKAPYDLVDHSVTVGPSRTTRRAHNERAQSLKAGPSSISAPLPPKKHKGVSKADVDSNLWTLIAEVKGKGKGKAHAQPSKPAYPATTSLNSRPKVKTALPTKPYVELTLRARGNTEESISTSSYNRRTNMGPPVDTPPSKRRKLDLINVTTTTENGSTRTSVINSTDTQPKRKLRGEKMKNAALPNDRSAPLSDGAAQVMARRVKLIVRKPPPSFSNPRQKPAPSRFDADVEAFLNSYTRLDNEDLDHNTLLEMAKKDAAVWKEVDALRRKGRMLYRRPDSPSPTSSNARSPERKPDIWDHVIKGIEEQVRTPKPDGRRIAAEVASRVKVYWEAQSIRDDKARLQEDRRLRALAKATIRLVTAKWKDAVHSIRHEERLLREAEERRRGHEHLDAILDQSGQILEAQQIELTRGDSGITSRSRSTSLSATLRHWASASASPAPELTGEDTEEDSDDASESGESHGDDIDQDPVNSRQLLGRSPSPPNQVVQTRAVVKEPDHFSISLQNGHTDAQREQRRPSSLLNGHGPISIPEINHLSRSSASSDSGAVRNTETSPSLNLPHEESLVASPLQADSSLPRSPSSRSSVEPEFLPEPIELEDDDMSEAALDVPPETPTSMAFDTMSATSGQDNAELTGKVVVVCDNSGTTELPSESITTPGISTPPDENVFSDDEDEVEEDSTIAVYLRPYAVAFVEPDSEAKGKAPLLLRGTLRPYQQAGLEWLANLHTNNLNGILADEMGLGKTIQTISLLAHLACEKGIWGPHLIIVPTSVLLNWEMEFKKFLPGFKVLSYHGNTKRRKELRQGWNNKYSFNVCVTSYALASRDAHVFKRKAWYYMILDEAHMIKNFKSQRWNILLMFRSFRRLLLTGTPLQNNLTELWALLQFLMSGTNFANLKEFGEWFSNPLEKAIEMGTTLDEETMQRVNKLHTVLRPYLLRRLKRDVEKELPSKFEHLVMCPLSKRQRFLYDEFMARADTRHDLQSGVYHKVANILMQLRKVVNHPDLFEVRPITTSFAMAKSAIADFEIKELLVRRELLRSNDEAELNLDFLGLRFIDRINTSEFTARAISRLDGTKHLPLIEELSGPPPLKDTRTINGHIKYVAYMRTAQAAARWKQIAYINQLRCNSSPVLSSEAIATLRQCHTPLLPLSMVDKRFNYLDTADAIHGAVKSYSDRAEQLSGIIQRFAFATPTVVARDLPAITLSGHINTVQQRAYDTAFDSLLHPASVKLQIAFPDPSLLQYDCGKLQELARLLRERKAGGHRVLIFTQMTKVLDILEIFFNFHGYLYLRLDGATKIEDRQYITERFNTDARVFCFISSSRSGGVGINLTGADTVIFYDSDFNPQMDRQCEDRAHRIGQIRDVHIYRLISQHTVEEALLRKANQKRSLDDLVIQKGEFDWRTLFRDEGALTKALGEVEDTEDAHAAAVAAREANDIEGADAADFAWEGTTSRSALSEGSGDAETQESRGIEDEKADMQPEEELAHIEDGDEGEEDDGEEGGTVAEYMMAFVRFDMEFFSDWRLTGF